MKYYIYLYTNKITSEKYIGYTKDIKTRQRQHMNSKRNTKFHNTLRKYGVENFNFEILNIVNSLELAKKLEIDYIAKMETFVCGYNMTLGGDGVSSETIMGHKNPNFKGKAWTDSSSQKAKEYIKIHRGGLKGECNPFFGKKHSSETKDKISRKNKHRVQPTDEKKLRSVINSGGRNPRAIPIIVDGIYFGCKKDAYRHFNCNKYQLTQRFNVENFYK